MSWRGLAVGAVLTVAACTSPKSLFDAGPDAPGATFLPVPPCNSAADYVPGAGITIRLTTDPGPAYIPACVKITTADQVTIQASVEHPVVGTTEANTSDVSPISMLVTTSDTTYSFLLPGFYSFQCPTEDDMRGVIWVAP